MNMDMPILGVYACNKFTGFYPVGSAAVVVADSQKSAADLLNTRLVEIGLKGDATANDMALVMQRSEQVVILCDGNY